MTVEIRKAGPEDAIAISGLCAAHAAFEKAAFNSAGHIGRLTELLSENTGQLSIIVAEQQGEIIGYASITKDISTWAAKPFFYLDCLFIAEKVRGKSVGKLLFAKVKALAVEHNITEIQWQTPEWNESAIRFYRKLAASESRKLRFTLKT